MPQNVCSSGTLASIMGNSRKGKIQGRWEAEASLTTGSGGAEKIKRGGISEIYEGFPKAWRSMLNTYLLHPQTITIVVPLLMHLCSVESCNTLSDDRHRPSDGRRKYVDFTSCFAVRKRQGQSDRRCHPGRWRRQQRRLRCRHERRHFGAS